MLAASSAIANIRNDTANHNASEAKILANLAESGLRDSDVTYDNRFKRYDDELEKKATLEELQQLRDRVALLEGLLCRVLSMMQNGNVDATEVRFPAVWKTWTVSVADILLHRLDRCFDTLAFDQITCSFQ